MDGLVVFLFCMCCGNGLYCVMYGGFVCFVDVGDGFCCGG